MHFHLLASALPSEERRIRTSYVPTLALVLVASTVVFVVLGLSKGTAPKLLITYGLLMAGIHNVLGRVVSAQNEAALDSVLGNI